MEECAICLEINKKIILLPHVENSNNNIQQHKMCQNCYKNLINDNCPFCRCKIILYNKKPYPIKFIK